MPAAEESAVAFTPGLLIAITGGRGVGKTRLMARLAELQQARGQRVEGVLALAGHRQGPDQGADEYWLRIIGTEEDLSWAVRDDSSNPPYAIEPGTERKLRLWAEQLAARPPLLLLDEFGKLEIAGRGLMPVWARLRATQPQIVVITVREENIPAIEQLLGRRFDLCLPADDPGTLPVLLRSSEDFGEWTRLGLVGGAAGGIEMTIGSLLHATKMPLRGLLMSSLQGAMMTFACFGLAQPGRVIWVPFISAGLKALSPAGSRVRPMIAISMQGLLYGGSVQILGFNAPAVALGGLLVGAWSALQGFFLQYLLMGDDLFRAYDAAVLWMANRWDLTAPSLPWLVTGWAIFCGLFAGGVTVAAWRWRSPPVALKRLIEKEPVPARHGKAGHWQDLAHWQFWLPLVIVSLILLATGHTWENVAWLGLRFVAVGFVLVTVVSLLRPARWAETLRRHGWWGPALAMSGAMNRHRSDKK
jgi:nucleoside-triphosphatase THEP1